MLLRFTEILRLSLDFLFPSCFFFHHSSSSFIWRTYQVTFFLLSTYTLKGSGDVWVKETLMKRDYCLCVPAVYLSDFLGLCVSFSFCFRVWPTYQRVVFPSAADFFFTFLFIHIYSYFAVYATCIRIQPFLLHRLFVDARHTYLRVEPFPSLSALVCVAPHVHQHGLWRQHTPATWLLLLLLLGKHGESEGF